MKKTEIETTDAQFSQAFYPVNPYVADDEISLVDIAKVLIRRRWWLLSVPIICVLAALLYAMTLKPVYRYISVYKLAEQAPNNSLSSVSGTLELVNNLYWPSIRREYINTNSILKVPFTFSVSRPDDTTLLLFSSEGEEDDIAEIKDVHQRVVENLDTYQQSLVVQRRTQLETQRLSLEKSLDTLNGNTNFTNAEVIVALYDRLSSVDEQLSTLEDAHLIQLAEQTGSTTKVGKSLILALGFVLGGMLGLVAAFVAEFVSRVRQSLRSDRDAASAADSSSNQGS